MDIRPKLLKVFQAEHKEHLDRIRAILAEAETSETALPGAALEEAFRRAHSLKGAARAVDLREVEKLAHRLETLFAKMHAGAAALDPSAGKIIHTALDTIEDTVDALLKNRPVPDPAAVFAALGPLSGEDPESSAGHERGAHPSPTPSPAPPIPSQPPADTLRVRTEHLDHLFRTTNSLLAEGRHQDLVAEEMGHLNREVLEMEKTWEQFRRHASETKRGRGGAPASRASRDLGSLDKQWQALSTQLRKLCRLQKRGAWTLRSLAEQLQQDIQNIRMVPVESIFESFPQMMRNLARDENKEFRFLLTGMKVEADRAMLQELKDPVMHLLRNAADHGIEPPGERKAKGKEAMGTICLDIETIGNRLHIRVTDDGRGINMQKVRQTAISRGLLAESAAAESSPDDLMPLLFQPGFSTADVVTELSGRGFGLSVVSEAVARLQGDVSVTAPIAGGNSVSLSVPLAASTRRLMLVSCLGQTFGIPLHCIESLDTIRSAEIETVENRQVLRREGRILPLQDLARLLGIADPAVKPEGERLSVLILKSGDKRAAVVVDAFLTQVESLVKNLDPHLARLGKFSGGILLVDGSVVLVLNPVELIEAFKKTPAGTVLNIQKPAAARKAPSILVVDDSITTRTLEMSILEAHGYEVEVAIDGIEALEFLRSHSFDLVVTDIQMPRMNGFGLLEEMKKDPLLAKLPVILVTSLENKTDQELGLSLGADAYIIKRKFDQRDLLDAIRQML